MKFAMILNRYAVGIANKGIFRNHATGMPIYMSHFTFLGYMLKIKKNKPKLIIKTGISRYQAT